MSDVLRCPSCLAIVRPTDRYCSYCQLALEQLAPREEGPTPAEPSSVPDLAHELSLSLAAEPAPETTGQAQVLDAWERVCGVKAQLIDAGLQHLRGLALFELGGEVLAVTLGFSELGTALYAYEDSGLGFELVCRLPATKEPIVTALDALRENQGTTGQPPRPFPESAPWIAQFAPAERLESIETVNGRVRFFETLITDRPRPETPAERSARVRGLAVSHSSAESPELEAAFLTRRDEQSAQVFADWLQAQGDVRGTLAALVRAETLDDEWIEANHEALFGALKVKVGEHVRRFRWNHGFLDGISLRGGSRWVHRPEDEGLLLHELTRDFLALPFGRFVRRLRFGVPSRRDIDWARTLEEVAKSPQAQAMLELKFDDYTFEDNELSWTPFGDFSSAWSNFPRLEVLHVRSGEGGTLGFLDLPRLRTFIRESGGLAASELADLHRARWPRLERLDLWTGQAEYGAQATVEDVERLLSAELPRLRRFGLINCEFVHEAIPTIARSPTLRQLRHLDLSKGVLNDGDVPVLLEHAAAFRHLEVLDLSANQLGPSATRQLERLCATVVLGDQRFDEGGEVDRYTAIGE